MSYAAASKSESGTSAPLATMRSIISITMRYRNATSDELDIALDCLPAFEPLSVKELQRTMRAVANGTRAGTVCGACGAHDRLDDDGEACTSCGVVGRTRPCHCGHVGVAQQSFIKARCTTNLHAHLLGWLLGCSAHVGSSHRLAACALLTHRRLASATLGQTETAAR